MTRIYVSLGTNIDREHYVKAGVQALRRWLGPLRLSSVYESEAVGFDGDPFYNMVIGADTELDIDILCQGLKQIEADNGRVRGAKKFSSRTLDLDLLTYGQQRCEHPVVLPREEILFNAFVLQPLAEIAPDAMHPGVNKSYKALWQAFDKNKQKLWTVSVNGLTQE